MVINSPEPVLKTESAKPSDYIQFLTRLLQAVSLHAVEGDAQECSRFKAQIDGVSKRLSEQSGSEEMSVDIGAVIQAMKEHNDRASGFLTAHVTEMKAMLGMMSSTIAFLASSSKTGVVELQAIERNLETAVKIDDVVLFRAKLSECLTVVRNESIRLRDASQKQIKSLQDGIARTANKLLPDSFSNDPTTGLQGRGKAEELIASGIADGNDAMVAIFLVDRLAPVNARFGKKVGDEVLLLVAQHLGQELPEASPPLRWSGPAFLVLIDLAEDSSLTERRIKQIASRRLEKYIDADGRSLMLHVSCSVFMQRIKATDSAEAVFRSLDKLIASHGGHPG